MVNREIVDFISSNLKRGLSDDEIQSQLLARGYSDFEISEAMNSLRNGQIIESPRYDEGRHIDSNWFWYALGVIVFVIFAFIVFGILFENVGSTEYTVTEDAIVDGKSFAVERNSLIRIPSYMDKQMELKLFAADSSASFSGDLGDFSIKKDGTSLFDLDEDGKTDLKIMYFHEGDQKMILFSGPCKENWVCGEWSECVLNKRFRDCADQDGCGTNTSKPSMVEACESNESISKNYTSTKVVEVPQNGTEDEYLNETNSS